MTNTTSTKTYDVYGLGAALVDTEIELSDDDLNNLSIDKGVMTLVDERKQADIIDALSTHMTRSKLASGGSAANSIIGASFLGASTFYSCRVANDKNGKFYLHDLAQAGVDYQACNGQAEGITGKCLVMVTPDAERTMNTFLGISETVNIDDIDTHALSQSHLVYIEGYLVTSQTGKQAAIYLREQAEKQHIKVALSLSDPAIVQYFHDGLSEMIGGGVELLFCNEAEALAYTKTDTIEQAIEGLKAYSRTFAITRGAQGAWLFDGMQLITVSSPQVDALDSNGAGDMFAGAFMASLAKGKSFEQAGALGCFAAAQVVTQFGPRLRPEQYQILEERFTHSLS